MLTKEEYRTILQDMLDSINDFPNFKSQLTCFPELMIFEELIDKFIKYKKDRKLIREMKISFK